MVRAALPNRRVSVSLVIRRVNQDAGLLMKLWALRYGSSDHREVKAISSPVALILHLNPLQCCPHERGSWSIPAPFWDSLTLEKKQPQPPGAQLPSRGRLTGAVARLSVERCLPFRERCPICGPGRRVCKDHFTFLALRNDSESAVSLKARG